MRVFRDLPLRRKLTLVIMLTSTAALLVSTIVLMVYEVARLRSTMARDISAEAAIIADNSTASVSFHDARAAQETLASLRNIPGIVFACIYGSDGRVFVRYSRNDTRDTPPPLASAFEGSRFEGRYLNVSRRIQLGDEVIGTVYLRVDLREETTRIAAFGVIAGSVTIVSWLVALMLSMRLQELISEPILALSRMARQIGADQDYTLRATKHGDDEIGALTDRFNHMLEQIQKRDQDLHASEERFRQVTESIREVFWMSDVTKNEMLYISPGYREIWGRPSESLYTSPQSWLDAIHPDDRERIQQAALTKQASGKYDEEYRIIRPDGSVRWIRDRAFPVPDADGKVYRIAGVADDVTERKQFVETLQRQQTELQVLFDLIPAMIWFKDANNKILRINKQAAEMAGKPVEEIEGKSTAEIHPREAMKFYADDLEVIGSGLPKLGIVESLRSLDGKTLWVQTDKVPYCDKNGKVIGIVVVAQDITERKLAEARMATLAHAVESTNELICITDLQDRFTFVNRAFMQAYGYAEHEVLGRKPDILFSPNNSPLLIEEILKQTRSDGWRGEVLDCRKDGTEFPISLSTSQIRDESGHVIGLMGVARDITERKRLEKEVLEISDRERARLGQDLHDDLCQELVSIAFAGNSLAQKLRKKSIPEASAADEIAVLLDSAITRARTLARGLCPVTLETEGLVVALQDLTTSVGGRFQMDCRLDCAEPVTVHDLTTTTHLYRIAQEAITNAVRHAHASGIVIRLESVDGEVTLSVADDGIGIQDPKNMKRGMGLQTMYCRATLIRGNLRIERGKTGGTEVICKVRLGQK